jgi:hypothetical protein
MLELCILGIVGYWGFRIGTITAIKITLAIILPVIVAVVWALFGAPHAEWGSTRYIACAVRNYRIWSRCCSVISFEASYASKWTGYYYCCFKSNTNVYLESIAVSVMYNSFINMEQ